MYTIEEDKKEKMRRCIFVALGLGLLTVFLFFLFVSASVLYLLICTIPIGSKFPALPVSPNARKWFRSCYVRCVTHTSQQGRGKIRVEGNEKEKQTVVVID